jgi:hypothetical protein
MSDAPDLANQIIDEWIAENTISDLLPCPFCGSEVEIMREGDWGAIVCNSVSDCVVSGLIVGFKLEDEITGIDTWNRRALPAVQPDLHSLVAGIDFANREEVDAAIQDATTVGMGVVRIAPEDFFAVQPDAREADASDAPVWYSSEQADAWASGYNAALALIDKPATKGGA